MGTKTTMKKTEEVDHAWYLVDVKDKVLGRAATEIAARLRGKYLVDFTPHVDGGAGVVVINCDKVRVTGRKGEQKVYKTYSGYPGGLREVVYNKMFDKDPTYVLRHAVKGMLPKNRLGARMLKRLKLYRGGEHPHAAQVPKAVEIQG